MAIGASVSALFLTRVFDVTVKFQAFMCLSLTVWLIYTADHLLDAKKLNGNASTQRHRFHQRYFNTILLCALIVLLGICTLLFIIHEPILYLGIRLGVLVVLYFILIRRLGFFKEMIGAALYCMGVMLPVIAFSNFYFLISWPSILLFITALINLILFSWFDSEKDKDDDQVSIVTSIGKKGALIVLYFLFLIQPIFILTTYRQGLSVEMVFTFFAMYIILIFIFINARWFASHDRFRLFGDAVFFIPLVYLLLQ